MKLWGKRITAAVLTLFFIAFLLLAAMDMPLEGVEASPIHNEVMAKYIEDSISDTGAVNVVAAMILDYRAFDTFVEASVIFTGLICIMIVLKRGGTNYEE